MHIYLENISLPLQLTLFFEFITIEWGSKFKGDILPCLRSLPPFIRAVIVVWRVYRVFESPTILLELSWSDAERRARSDHSPSVLYPIMWKWTHLISSSAQDRSFCYCTWKWSSSFGTTWSTGTGFDIKVGTSDTIQGWFQMALPHCGHTERVYK